MAKQEPPRADVYARVTDQIVQAIEHGAPEWEMPWHTSQGALVYPTNAMTGQRYRGINVLSLWAEGMAHAYASPLWATFNQWRELGYPVKKGERATTGVLWKPLDLTNASPEKQAEGDGRSWLMRAFSLFNADQVEGYQPPRVPDVPMPQRIAHADRFFGNLSLAVYHGGHRALYAPVTDRILMPAFAAFSDPLAYYGTLAHETTHWTGHASRLARDLTGRFASDSYAMEELVAELGSAFLSADLGLVSEPRPENAAYVQNWLNVMKADSRAVFVAAGQAQRAADYLHSLQPTSALKAEVNAGALSLTL